VSHEEAGKFEMPVELLWQEGLALSSLFKLPKDPWILVKGMSDNIMFEKILKTRYLTSYSEK
jgi:hypothetical protein